MSDERIGMTIKDAGQLRPGDRVRCQCGCDNILVLRQRTGDNNPADGTGWLVAEGVLWDDLVSNNGVLVMSSLPREATIEERRRALSHGDVLTSADQFEAGMRIRLLSGYNSQGEYTLDQCGWQPCGQGERKWRFEGDTSWCAWESNIPRNNFVFLAHAPEAKGGGSETLAPYVPAKWKSEIADKLVKLVTDERALAPALTPPAKALPFKRHGGCLADHSAPVMCLTCEALWADSTAAHDRDIGEHRYVTAKSVTRPLYEPQCGAFVGRVMTPVVRR